MPPAAPPSTPSRAPVPIGLVILAVVLALGLLATGVVAAILLDSRRTPTAAPTSVASPASPSPSEGVKLSIAQARDFDPQGDPPEENPGDVAKAIDGNPSTRWRTNWYVNYPKFGRLKRGVGLVLDLGRPQQVSSLSVGLVGNGADFDVRVPAANPATTNSPPMSSDARWQVVAIETKASGTVQVQLEAPVTTRFVLVYLTSLPPDTGNRYRGGFSEIEVYS
jgi:putative peptidoglycan lipid II flippase